MLYKSGLDGEANDNRNQLSPTSPNSKPIEKRILWIFLPAVTSQFDCLNVFEISERLFYQAPDGAASHNLFCPPDHRHRLQPLQESAVCQSV